MHKKNHSSIHYRKTEVFWNVDRMICGKDIKKQLKTKYYGKTY